MLPQNRKTMADILRPVPKPPLRSILKKRPVVQPIRTKKSSVKKVLYLTLVGFLLVAIVYAHALFNFKNSATQSASIIQNNLKSAASSLFNLETENAKQDLQVVKENSDAIAAQSDQYGLSAIASAFSSFYPKLQAIPAAIQSIASIGSTGVALAETLDTLKKNGFSLFFQKQGDQFLKILNDLSSQIAKLSSTITNLKNQASILNYPIPDNYVAMNVELSKGQQFLQSIVSWLNSSQTETKHFLVIFQNPTEIRPGGGFIGSYADLAISSGSLAKMDVRDIYDPDGQLAIKVIPPKPLQGVTTKWGARDSNWFFDFPTSAQKTIQFLETSKIYKEQNVHFDGALAINVRLLEDLIDLVGPIELPQYKLTLDKNNFLAEVQKEVEAGDNKKINQPKKILQELTPIIFERLSQLNDQQKKDLISIFQNRIQNKDVLAYFKDQSMENYIQSSEIGGEVFNLPQNFGGDYLAVVNANVGGGKSDAFIKEKVKLSSVIDISGKINDQLIVERTHSGQNEKDWWYKSTNKDFLQIFSPYQAKLLNFSGTTDRTITPIINYAKNGFITDRDLKAIENSDNQFGKTVFSGWLYTPAGTTKKAELLYTLPNRMTLKDTNTYQFIYEKQSGVDNSLEFVIEAPAGFKWLESNDNIFSYFTENAPKRLVLNLNFVAIK